MNKRTNEKGRNVATWVATSAFRGVLVSGLLFFLSACDLRQSPVISSSFDETHAVQTRVNDYFHTDVLPKLRPCWSQIPGEGRITIDYDYRRDGGLWVPEEVNVGLSPFSAEQNQAVLSCMQDAVTGTSFPVDDSEKGARKYVLHWTWPVPLPAPDSGIVVLQKKKNGDVDCDGHGTGPKCVACTNPGGCKDVCVGYKGPCEQPQPNVCVTESTVCASGGPFSIMKIVF